MNFFRCDVVRSRTLWLQASRRFKRITGAYHTLTTNNFDYERWSRSYTIPPMQSLDDVLQMALGGRDPFEIEAVLRARGEYRPHQDFGGAGGVRVDIIIIIIQLGLNVVESARSCFSTC